MSQSPNTNNDTLEPIPNILTDNTVTTTTTVQEPTLSESVASATETSTDITESTDVTLEPTKKDDEIESNEDEITIHNNNNNNNSENEKIESHHDNNLIVNYIPPDMYEDEFRNLFNSFGDIISLKLVRDKANGTSLGYGFVMYKTKTSAEIAIRELNGKNIRGKHLKVAFAGKPGSEASNTNVYVANISEDATKEAVEKMFGRYGKVVEMNVLTDKSTGKNKGIAFIKYEKRTEAERAIDDLNGTNPPGISSKPLTLKVNIYYYF